MSKGDLSGLDSWYRVQDRDLSGFAGAYKLQFFLLYIAGGRWELPTSSLKMLQFIASFHRVATPLACLRAIVLAPWPHDKKIISRVMRVGEVQRGRFAVAVSMSCSWFMISQNKTSC